MIFSEAQWHKVARSKYQWRKNEELHKSRNSLLNIIANTAEVKVWILQKGMLDFLPKNNKKIFYSRIKQCEDVDRPFKTKKIDRERKKMNRMAPFKG